MGDAETVDYVVVGSGAGGGPVAARLARAGWRVLVLEAGGVDGDADYAVPGFHARATEHPDMRWNYYVRHYDDDERQRRDSKYVAERDGVLYPRAGTVGGCTAHNAMITVYPHPSDFDRIAEITGDRSWRAGPMRRYFELVEDCGYITPPRLVRNPVLAWLLRRLPLRSGRFTNVSGHGWGGWLHTGLADPRLAIRDGQLIRVVIGAVRGTLQSWLARQLRPFEDLDTYVDPNDARLRGKSLDGLWMIPLAVRGGRRNGTRELLLGTARTHPDRLDVRTGALACRVLFDGTSRAVGVEYVSGRHLYRADPAAPGAAEPLPAPRRVRVTREVILSAGAFNTPQLLTLSGIGPRDELRRLGIPVVADLPGVGKNLQDRYEVGVISELADAFEITEDAPFRPPPPGQSDRWFSEWQAGRGVYTTNGAVVGITRRSRPELDVPDLFLFGLPALFRGYHPGYSDELLARRNHFTWAVLKAHTNNTAGRLTLRSTDPRDPPAISFRYFEEGNDPLGADLEAVVTGVEFARSLMRHAPGVVHREILPGDDVATRDQLRQFVRDEAWGHHACGTCKIGAAEDPMSVLDSRFRVRGVQGLRVVDASVFPRIPGFFIVTAVYMVAEKAAAAILADAWRAVPHRAAFGAARGFVRGALPRVRRFEERV